MELEILEITAVYAVLIPGTVTAVALLLLPQRLAPLAIVLGYWAGYYGIQGWPPFPPVESTQWLPWMVVGMTALCVAHISNSPNTRWHWLLAFLILSVTSYILLLPAFKYSWGLAEGLGRLSFIVAAGLLFWAGLLFKPGRVQPSAPAALLLTVAGGAAVIAGVSGSVILSQLAAVQAATLGAGFLIALWRGKPVLEYSGLLHLVILSGLLVSGWYFVEVPVYSFVPLIAAPWLALSISKRVPEVWPVWAYLLIVMIVSLAAVSLACYIAVTASPPLDFEY